MTAADIIQFVIDQVVLPEHGWEKVLRDVENDLILEYQITLKTELTEA